MSAGAKLEQDPSVTHRMPIGRSKIRDVHRWGIPAAELIHARATAFFSLAIGNPKPTVEQSWASFSRLESAHHRRDAPSVAPASDIPPRSRARSGASRSSAHSPAVHRLAWSR